MGAQLKSLLVQKQNLLIWWASAFEVSGVHLINGKPVQFRENGLFVSAYYEENQVGRVKSHGKGDATVLLGDIEVEERVEIREGQLAQFIMRFRPDWRVIFPRGNKIAAELLRRFIQACERREIREIYRNVTPEADRNQPF